MLVLLFLLVQGCTATRRIHADQSVWFADILNAYPQTNEPLSIARITAPTTGSSAFQSAAPDISIIVHPAYAVFIDRELDDQYPEVIWGLIKRQFENEAKFIREQALRGNIVVLVIPAGSVPESGAQSAYVAYLNKTTLGGKNIFYVFSETAEDGDLTANDVALLCGFFESNKAGKILLGGGYIGRCQGELYSQIVSYCSAKDLFIVPEISTISPEDITDEEASRIYSGMKQQDYAPVVEFIRKKTEGHIHLLSIPQMRDSRPDGTD